MKSLTTSVLLFLAAAVPAFATPSGLNNIPTADTVPDRTVAVQAFDTFGSGEHDFWMGFKTGFDFSKFNLEVGLDSRLAPDPAGPLYAQTKVNFAPWEKGLLAVGVANIFTYAVVTHDFRDRPAESRLRSSDGQ